jgi:hypothetical protein
MFQCQVPELACAMGVLIEGLTVGYLSGDMLVVRPYNTGR